MSEQQWSVAGPRQATRRTAPPDPADWEPLGSIRGPEGPEGPQGPPGLDAGAEDMTDLTIIFENGLL